MDQPVLVRWHPAAGIVTARKDTFTLRCVEEWFEVKLDLPGLDFEETYLVPIYG